eukprot:m.20279 g.20279  ORF g.20279 m.20279 type:complete len:487 (+) comp31882_c0_seq1:94-1554(+)
MRILLALALVVCAHQALGHSAAEWKYRSIYQLLTDRFAQPVAGGGTGVCENLSDYCGGTFQGVINQLDYIVGLGFNAIWISPMVLNTPQGYHGYWAQDIYSVNPNFGSEQDLQNLVQACHAKGIWVMLDVVANHMGNQDNINDFSAFVPFNDSSHYHPYCQIQDWTNQQQVEFCRLANLPDLMQENSYVADTLTAWISSVISTYGFDGIRIDTVPEVPPWFWTQYNASAGVFTIGEVDNGDVQYVAEYQPPLDATLNYPFFYTITQVYAQHQSMYDIRTQIQAEDSAFHDVTVLGLFADNHDNPRFLNVNSDWNLLSNALAYVLFAQGIPIVYYGSEQAFNGGNDPYCRENLWQSNFNVNHPLYLYISHLNSFRNAQINSIVPSQHIERYCDDTFYAWSRDMVFIATSNIGSGQATSRTITYHPYSDGTVLIDMLDSTITYTVQNGQFPVNIQNGEPQLLFPQSMLGAWYQPWQMPDAFRNATLQQ